jgi:hypothetical protein
MRYDSPTHTLHRSSRDVHMQILLDSDQYVVLSTSKWHRDREREARRRGRIQCHLIEILVSCTTSDDMTSGRLKHARMHIAAALNVVSQE